MLTARITAAVQSIFFHRHYGIWPVKVSPAASTGKGFFAHLLVTTLNSGAKEKQASKTKHKHSEL